jgi:hypothetical protein
MITKKTTMLENVEITTPAFSKTIISSTCPACHHSISIGHNNTIQTVLLSHFRDNCPQRLSWIQNVLPKLPVYLWSLLGMWKPGVLNFQEWSFLLQMSPRINKSGRIALSKLFIEWAKQTWKQIVQWDKEHHFGIPWMSSGTLVTHYGVLCFLYPHLYSNLGKPVFVPPNSNKKKKVECSTIALKRDPWLVKNKQCESYLVQKYQEFVNKESPAAITTTKIWTYQPHRIRSVDERWIGQWSCGTFDFRLFSNLDRNENENKQNSFYLLPIRETNLSVYDCLTIECLSQQKLSDVFLKALIQSFKTAWNSYLQLHKLTLIPHLEHIIYTSHCRRYVMLQTDCRQSMLWSIQMQYHFIAWWMALDQSIYHFFTLHRKTMRLSIPYLVPSSVNGKCPYCYRFELTDHIHDVCRVKTILEWESLLNDQILFPTCDRFISDIQIFHDSLPELHLCMINWLRENAKYNRNLVAISHCKSQTLPHDLERLLLDLQKYSICSSHCQSSYSKCQPLSANPIQTHHHHHHHEWQLINTHDIICKTDYIYGKSQSLVCYRLLKIYCKIHYSNFILCLDRLYGQILVYNVLDLYTPHFISKNSFTWGPALVWTLDPTQAEHYFGEFHSFYL